MGEVFARVAGPSEQALWLGAVFTQILQAADRLQCFEVEITVDPDSLARTWIMRVVESGHPGSCR